MQTFLPYSDFDASARVLDRKRLRHQPFEAFVIFETLVTGKSRHTDQRYAYHPAVAMWRGAERMLLEYMASIETEIARRNDDERHGGTYKPPNRLYTDEAIYVLARQPWPERIGWELPAWYARPPFHLSHKSNLLRKDPDHYRPIWPDLPDNLAYVWPKEPIHA